MSEELLRGIEEYTEFLTPTTELMDELNHESDEDHDMILSFDEGSVKLKKKERPCRTLNTFI